MNVTAILVSILAAAVLSAVVSWLLLYFLPKPPGKPIQVWGGIFTAIVLALLAAWPYLLELFVEMELKILNHGDVEGIYLIEGGRIVEYNLNDQLIVYDEIIANTEVPIALLQVIAKNPNTISAQEILVHPDREVEPGSRVDDRLGSLDASQLVPANGKFEGYYQQKGRVRIRPGANVNVGDTLRALEPQLVGSATVDYLEFDPPIEMRVAEVGVESAIARVELVKGDWPQLGTVVVGDSQETSSVPTASKERTDKQSPTATFTLSETATIIATATTEPKPEPTSTRVSFKVCTVDKETLEITRDSTIVVIAEEEELEYSTKVELNGCLRVEVPQAQLFQSVLLVVEAPGFQTQEVYIDVLENILVQVELERFPTPTPTPTFVPTSTPVFNSLGTPLSTSSPVVEGTQEPEVPTPTPTIPASVLKTIPELLEPALGQTVYAHRDGRAPTTFRWYWPGQLPQEFVFEVRIWNVDLDPVPLGAHDVTGSGFRAPVVRYERDGTYSISLRLRDAAGYRLSVTNYVWTVGIVRLDPYLRVGQEAEPRAIFIQDAP